MRHVDGGIGMIAFCIKELLLEDDIGLIKVGDKLEVNYPKEYSCSIPAVYKSDKYICSVNSIMQNEHFKLVKGNKEQITNKRK